MASCRAYLEKLYPRLVALILVTLGFALLHNGGQPGLIVCLGSFGHEFFTLQNKGALALPPTSCHGQWRYVFSDLRFVFFAEIKKGVSVNSPLC